MTYPAAMVQVLERQLDAALLGIYVSRCKSEQVVLSLQVRTIERRIADWKRLDRKACS